MSDPAEAPEVAVESSEKEKESAKEEEKDTDTSKLAPSAAGTPKPGSAKPGSAKSARGTPRSAKPSPSATPKSKTKPKAKAKEEKKDEEEGEGDEAKKDDVLPPDAIPFFMTTKTQEIFECTAGEQVTEESPFKLIPKADIQNDLKMRAGVCDFAIHKQVILDYPGDEILVMWDAEFKWGQNFVLALTEEAKEILMNPPKPEGAEGEAGVEGEEEELEPVVYKYIPPVSKPWVSQGSEKEIEESAVTEHRKKIKFSVKRIRREFGAPVTFTDRNVGDVKDGYMECTSYEDKTFDLKRIEVDKCIQAIPEFSDSGTQTEWKHPRNATCQYNPREFDEKTKEELNAKEDLKESIKSVAPRFELSLQQNEIMDVFYDDWQALADEDGSFGGKADNHLKEYQSFTDLQFSKDKTVTCIDWHPTIKGVLAVSVAEKISFDNKVDHAAKIIHNPNLILIWSFTDPIHPQLLLEAPEDILCFRFCPTDPNIIAGGCSNGQLVLWDISAHVERLRTPRSSRKKNINTLPGFEDENALDTPIVRYCAVSSIEHSHKAPITDILWVPDHMEINRMGVPQENRQQQCVQIMTCGCDHSVLVWDTRSPKGVTSADDKGGLKNPMGVPTTFKYLDLTWKPHLKIYLSRSEPGGDHSPCKFSIQERQGDRSVLESLGESKEDGKNLGMSTGGSGGFGFSTGKPSSGKEKRTLQDVKTHFFVGGEDGEVIYADWMPQKDQDSGKIQTPKPDFYNTFHDGPICCLQRSPFFKDILLSVGGWTLAIWKEGVNAAKTGPILASSASGKRLTGGHWSPSRPGVFYITRYDGSVDVWDLLDRTHEPSLNQNVSAVPLTCIYPYQVSSKQHLLAAGDNTGTLHIMEIPWSLRQPTPNEHMGVSNYFEREVKRRAFVVARWDFRELEKREIEAEAKRKAGIAPNVQLSEEEIEYRMKQEYMAYLEEEGNFLRALGLKEDVDEPLPET